MKRAWNNPVSKKIVLFTILGLTIGSLMLSTINCNGVCVDKTKFCAIVKELAPSNVQPAFEDCPTSLIICDGEQVELYWQADPSMTNDIHIIGPLGESYDFSLIEGHATVTPRTSGFWTLEFIGGNCKFSKSIWVRVIKGEELHTIVANGNSDIGFFCDINPKSVSSKLIVKKIRSAKCAGVSEHWQNWSCTKTDWNGSNEKSFNITNVFDLEICTILAGHWHFKPMALSQEINIPQVENNFPSTTKTACFETIITCGPCVGTPSDIYPTPTPPWRTSNP